MRPLGSAAIDLVAQQSVIDKQCLSRRRPKTHPSHHIRDLRPRKWSIRVWQASELKKLPHHRLVRGQFLRIGCTVLLGVLLFIAINLDGIKDTAVGAPISAQDCVHK